MNTLGILILIIALGVFVSAVAITIHNRRDVR